MSKEIVFNPQVTPPRGPYAQAIKVSESRTTIYTGTTQHLMRIGMLLVLEIFVNRRAKRSRIWKKSWKQQELP